MIDVTKKIAFDVYIVYMPYFACLIVAFIFAKVARLDQRTVLGNSLIASFRRSGTAPSITLTKHHAVTI